MKQKRYEVARTFVGKYRMRRVALIGENSIQYVNFLLDIWNSGECAVLVDWRIPLATAVEMMIEAKVSRCIIERNLFEQKREIVPESIEFITYEQKNGFADKLPEEFYDRFQENYSNEEALILFSSGTTGHAKGVILSFYAINTNADSIIEYMKPQKDDCMYIGKALTHASTLVGELLVALKTRIKLVIAPTVVPPRFWISNMMKFEVSIICLNPTLLSMLSDEIRRKDCEIKFLRKVYVSGSVLSEHIYKKALDAFMTTKIYNVYGLSEAGPRVAAQREGCCKLNSVGHPIGGVKVQLRDGEKRIEKDNIIGSIYVNTPSLMLGYVSARKEFDEDGWFDTGDVGYLDNDELFVVGRSDDIIINNSHNLYPYTVEKVINLHKDVDDCIVFMGHIRNNETLVCIYTGMNEVPARELYTLCIDKLAPYEIPREYVYVSCFYKNKNGKIDRKGIIEAYERRKVEDE